jgi:uncharacterized protein
VVISTLMKIDLRQVQPEGSDFHFSESAEEMEISIAGVKFPSPIEVDITAIQTGDEIICRGEVYAHVEVECSRCLEIFDHEIETGLQFVVQLMDAPEGDKGENEDFEIIPKTQTSLDISQRVRDAIILETSLKPLCSEDCKGLCPMCGINLNEGTCDCTPDKVDERWDSLKNLFDNQ